ncbi:CocE/NonD family hydrolase [Cellulomonas sp. SLBN-39]|uniref:CocE/NonD family hydrolase n=1 Tax=Cellulomonas sp. SLBN-39 TaxID=2768446 RepID=UPI00114F5295|nr:CocE/NonD family hydrolase [Cellulomonas sp. SLBN-39]TQL02722.1 hypothetical protein FBY24_1803 [Cellulomonas sp. SLBN-39]
MTAPAAEQVDPHGVAGGGAVSVVERLVPVPLADGTVLRATVHRPVTDAPVPVVLALTPYPVDGARAEMGEDALVERGLAVVVVALRGTGASDGTFEPWAGHRDDGRDVLDWCVRQPWCSGAVVGWGRSYLAQTLLAVAAAGHPALRALHLGVVPGDPVGVVYRGGALLLGSALGWVTAMGRGEILRAAAAGQDVAADLAAWEELAEAGERVALDGVVADHPVLARWFPAWRDWVTHPPADPWWAERALPPRPALPTFLVAGWHDIFRDLTLDLFATCPPGSRLVVGPWGHGPAGRAIGAVDHGRAAARGAEEVGAQVLDHLVGHATGEPVADAPRVRVFVMGEDAWRGLETWPPPANPTAWYLRPGGSLGPEPAPAAAPSAFVHDPADPVPTVGGPNLFARGDAARGTGAWDRRVLDGRADVLRFDSPPLADDVTVIGDVEVTLVASTDALDTDWTATLVDVHPDGTALGVVDGVVRVGQVLGAVPPDEPREVTVHLGATAQRFGAGHRLRLEVASSSFPRFDVNPGTGALAALTGPAGRRVVHQRVHHDATRPSRLVLPVVPDLP